VDRLLGAMCLLAFALSAGSSSLRAADSPKPPPLSTDASKVFLSTVTVTNYGDSARNRIETPNKARLQGDVFYDQPIAVHVPFEVPYQGRPVRIHVGIAVSFDFTKSLYRQINLGTHGIYRQDGKPLPPDSVVYANSRTPDSGKWVPMWFNASAPIPGWINSTPPPQPEHRLMPVRTDTSEGMGNEPLQRDMENPFVLKKAEPGPYVFWFTVANWGDFVGWPEGVTAGTVKITLRVSLLVTAAEDPSFLFDPRHAYLFHGGPRPDRMAENQFYRAYRLDVPVTLSRNGWVFDRAEVAVNNNKVLQKRLVEGDLAQDIQAQTKVTGRSVTMSLRTSTNDRGRPIGQDSYGWEITLPPSFSDNDVADVLIGGFQKLQWEQGNLARPPLWVAWRSAGFVVPGELFKEGVDVVACTGCRWDADSPEFKSKVGPKKNAILGDHRPIEQAPGQGQPPHVIRYYAQSPIFFRKGVPEVLGSRLIVGQVALGPWVLKAYYRRRSELGPQPIASVGPGTPVSATNVEESDPFWKWYPSLSRVLNDRLRKITLLEVDAGLEAASLQELQRSARALALDMVDTDRIKELSPTASLSEILAYAAQRVVRAGEDAAASGDTRAALSDQAWARKHKLLQQKILEIELHRRRVGELTAQARAAAADVLAKLDEGWEKFKETHPDLLLVWRREYRALSERIPFDIAVASKDRGVLRQAFAEAETAGLSARTRVLEAQLRWSDGDPVGALYALRSAVTVDPNDPVAAKMLADLECSFLKTAIDKSQGAIQQARKAFYEYLLERGFKSDDVRVTGDWAFARASSWTVSAAEVYGEEAWAILTTGLFGSFSAAAGKPAAEADLLATTEHQMTTAFVGLNTMLRLRARGYTFDAIRKMTSAQVREALPLRDLNGNLYSEEKARLHCVAIREAMNLPDVKALVANDRVGLQIGLQKAYWNARDVGDTWLEHFGDATSVYNLFMMLPMAKVGMAGRAGLLWTQADLAMMQDLEKMGKVISGTEAVANTVGLTQMLGEIGAWPSGQFMLTQLRRLGKYQEGLQWFDKAVWTTGKIVGALAISFGAVIGTEIFVGHKAAMLLQAALLFGADSELLLKFLKSRGIPPEKVASLIINEYLPATQLHLKRLAQIEKTGGELRALFERVRKGTTLSVEDRAFLNKYFDSGWRKLIPNGQASHDISIALGAAGERAQNALDRSALDVSTELEPELQQEAKGVARAQSDGKKLADALNGGAVPSRGPPPPQMPPTVPRDLQRAVLDTKRGMTAGSYPREVNYPLPPLPPEGSECAKAEALLHLGKYKEAQEQYEIILNRILDGELRESAEMPLEYVHLKRLLAYELQGSKKLTPGKLSTRFSILIAREDVEFVLNNPQLWKKKNPKQGVMGEVFPVEGKDFMVKNVYSKQKDGKVLPAVVLNDVEGNVVHGDLIGALNADLGKDLALNTPAFELRLVYDEKGEVLQKAVYVMRKVKGMTLDELTAAEVFQLRDQLSRHRALSVLINDYDRKIDNYIMTSDGRLFALDAGIADPMGQRFFNGRFDDPLIMEGGFGRDHWLSRSYKDELCGKDSQGNRLLANAPKIQVWSPYESFARKNLVAEEALTHSAAKPVIDAIGKLLGDKPRLRNILDGSFRKIYGTEAEIQRRIQAFVARNARPGQAIDMAEIRNRTVEVVNREIEKKVNDCVATLEARGKRLDEVMQGLQRRHPGVTQLDRRRLLPPEGAAEEPVCLEFLEIRENFERAA